VQLVVAPKAGCCGALRHHLDEQEAALDDVRRNIDAWWPYVEGGNGAPVEAIVMTASGCGVMVKDYGHLLAHDPAYAAKAERISALTLDLSEVLARFEPQLATRLTDREGPRVAYHPPCTLQHGQKIRGHAERLLALAGVDVVLCQDSHLCCGSAGTYSVLQPELSAQLRERKVANLEATGAQEIASANIGCLSHLQGGTNLPVRHWIEFIEEALARPAVTRPNVAEGVTRQAA
jgi:glycolate oxidase iron-sulfur subunit